MTRAETLKQMWLGIVSCIRSGVPILRTFESVRQQFPVNDPLGKVLEEFGQTARDGGMIADCMRKHPEFFTDFDIAVISAGELNGCLDDAAYRLANFPETPQLSR